MYFQNPVVFLNSIYHRIDNVLASGTHEDLTQRSQIPDECKISARLLVAKMSLGTSIMSPVTLLKMLKFFSSESSSAHY